MTPLPTPPPLISRSGSASGNLRVRCSNWHLDYRYCNFLFQEYFTFQLFWLESKKYSHRTRKNLKQVLGNGSKASSAILDISEIARVYLNQDSCGQGLTTTLESVFKKMPFVLPHYVIKSSRFVIPVALCNDRPSRFVIK